MTIKEKIILPKIWKGENDENISCTEKIKILNENIIEINQITDDAIEDAILMGADPKQFIETIIKSMKEKNTDISNKKN
jgi:hypothetical protein